MTATIRPSLILNMDVDARQYSDDLVAEVKRSYSYVAPSVVAPAPAADAKAPIENILRLVVRLHRSYWDANDAAAREQWDAVMPQWLKNMFYKVSSTVGAFNEVRRKAGENPVPYAWMEVEFGDNLTVAQATEAGSAFPADALNVVKRARDLACSGVLGEGAVRISVPSRASWEAQRAAALEAARLEEAAGSAAEEQVVPGADGQAAEKAAEAAETAGAVEAAIAAEAAGAAVVADEAAADAETGIDVGAMGNEAPSDLATDETPALRFAPAFEVDRTLWGVEYADGTVRTFDSAQGAFVD